jgi:hypothetical protein
VMLLAALVGRAGESTLNKAVRSGKNRGYGSTN